MGGHVSNAALRDSISLALSNNQDVQISLLNVERARSLLGIANAGALPTVDLSGGTTHAQGTTSSRSLSLNMAAYEIDLFGRVKNLKRRALHDFLQSEEASRSAQLLLQTETAQAWIVLAADLQLQRNGKRQLELLIQLYEKVLGRYRSGAAGELELRQADSAAQQARLQMATLDTQVQKSLNALELLVGSGLTTALLPTADTRLDQLFAADAEPPGSIPSERLLARPDVLAAEQALQATYAGVGVARAERFPRLSITAAYSTSATGGTPSTSLWNAASNITLPMLDQGAGRNRVKAAQVDLQIATASYRRTIQVAVRETADALADAAQARSSMRTAAAVVASTERQVEIEGNRYAVGKSRLSDLLQAQRQLGVDLDAQTQANVKRAAAAVGLYRALGGAWNTDPTGRAGGPGLEGKQ